MNAGVIFFILLVLIIFASLWTVPENSLSARFFLGRYVGSSEEGLRPWWPEPIGRMDFYSRKPIALTVEATVNTREEKDNESKKSASNQVTVKYTLTLKPDSDLLGTYRGWLNDPDGDLDNDARKKAFERLFQDIQAKVKDIFQTIAGQYSYSVFIDSHRAIQTWVDAVLRGGEPPHHMTRNVGNGFEFDPLRILPDGNFYEGSRDVVPLEKRIEFYNSNHSAVSEWLKSEENRPEERSRIETHFGIDIGPGSLDPSAFSEDMKKALELQRKTNQRLASVDPLAEKVAQVVKETRLSPEEARDMVLKVAADVPMQIYVARGKTDFWITPEEGRGSR